MIEPQKLKKRLPSFLAIHSRTTDSLPVIVLSAVCTVIFGSRQTPKLDMNWKGAKITPQTRIIGAHITAAVPAIQKQQSWRFMSITYFNKAWLDFSLIQQKDSINSGSENTETKPHPTATWICPLLFNMLWGRKPLHDIEGSIFFNAILCMVPHVELSSLG